VSFQQDICCQDEAEIGIYIGTGLILVFLLPYPYDFISVFGLFILLTIIRMKSMMKRYGARGGIKDTFSSLSSSMPGNNQSRPLRYYCMGCGIEHRETACPNCGPRMKRVG
jgi:hypothetical protein